MIGGGEVIFFGRIETKNQERKARLIDGGKIDERKDV